MARQDFYWLTWHLDVALGRLAAELGLDGTPTRWRRAARELAIRSIRHGGFLEADVLRVQDTEGDDGFTELVVTAGAEVVVARLALAVEEHDSDAGGDLESSVLYYRRTATGWEARHNDGPFDLSTTSAHVGDLETWPRIPFATMELDGEQGEARALLVDARQAAEDARAAIVVAEREAVRRLSSYGFRDEDLCLWLHLTPKRVAQLRAELGIRRNG